jgi:hypothetical protein
VSESVSCQLQRRNQFGVLGLAKVRRCNVVELFCRAPVKIAPQTLPS